MQIVRQKPVPAPCSAKFPAQAQKILDRICRPARFLADEEATFVPVAEAGSAITTVEPRLLFVASPLGTFFKLQAAHVTHGQTPTFLTHIVPEKKRALATLFLHHLLKARGRDSDLVLVCFRALLHDRLQLSPFVLTIVTTFLTVWSEPPPPEHFLEPQRGRSV